MADTIKALVIGLGDTGLSCVRWLKTRGAEIRATDTRMDPPHAGTLANQFPEVPLTLGVLLKEDIDWADVLVVSPGVPISTPEIANSDKLIVGDVELFALAWRDGFPVPGEKPGETETKLPFIVGITGSNGKSTVTSMVAAMCAEAGMNVCMAGNIGLPVLDAMLEIHEGKRLAPEVFVLELSSFQLETTYSLEPWTATVLNISEDHLDRYASLEDYANAKARIFQAVGIQVLNRDDPMSMAMSKEGTALSTFGLDAPSKEHDFGLLHYDNEDWLSHGEKPLMRIADLNVPGRHNQANALAAMALCHGMGIPDAPMLAALRYFKGLPHRVELVREVNGVRYYDDSKGTNVGATEAAMKGFELPVVLIAGGDGKSQDFSPLKAAVADARAVVLIGRDAPLIEAAIDGAAPVHHAKSLEEAVKLAAGLAQKGDAVMLSPACASYDMFRNYVHRAEVFAQAVMALPEIG